MCTSVEARSATGGNIASFQTSTDLDFEITSCGSAQLHLCPGGSCSACGSAKCTDVAFTSGSTFQFKVTGDAKEGCQLKAIPAQLDPSTYSSNAFNVLGKQFTVSVPAILVTDTAYTFSGKV